MYPKELFRNNHYRVVFSSDEDREMQSQGWSEEREPERKYVAFNSGIPEEVPEGTAEPARRGPGRPKKIEA